MARPFRWFFLKARGRTFAFKTSAERDFWSIKSRHAEPITNHEFYNENTKSKQKKIKEDWPNKAHNDEELLEFYMVEMDKVEGRIEKLHRKRRLMKKIIEEKTGCTYKRARPER